MLLVSVSAVFVSVYLSLPCLCLCLISVCLHLRRYLLVNSPAWAPVLGSLRSFPLQRNLLLVSNEHSWVGPSAWFPLAFWWGSCCIRVPDVSGLFVCRTAEQRLLLPDPRWNVQRHLQDDQGKVWGSTGPASGPLLWISQSPDSRA